MDVEQRFLALEQRLADNETEIAQLRETLYLTGSPVPPPKHLQLRVSGIFHPDFVPGGARGVAIVKECVEKHDSLPRIRRAWDFGCGCGRLSSHFSRLHPEIQFVGSDIDPEAINWLQTTKTENIAYYVNPLSPPCEFEGEFDLIYAISVFTHLPEEFQFDWLKELRRQSAPGAILALTKSGAHFVQHYSRRVQAEFAKKGFCYVEGPKTEGLPSCYRSTLHSDEYIHRVWSEYFKILEIVPQGYDGHQDIVVAKKC
jgi:2-polyprenyl-3-methyl-5-hydroxy-6-metoxy-1,4-benzoquinol methylase